jgi:hypothetical protein
MNIDPPIQNVENIDLLGERNDGGIDLIIVASGPLDGSSTTLNLLEQKIRNYVTELSSPSFINEFGSSDNKFAIYIVCEYSIDPAALNLIEQLKSVVSVAGAKLGIRQSMDE